MAYTITLSIDLASDLLSGTLNDETVFGGANPARSAVRVFVTGSKMKYNNTVKQALTITPNGDADTATAYVFNYVEDGWHKFNYVIIIDEYAGGTEYALYDAVYSGDTVYRSKQAVNTGHALNETDWWELISDPASLAANKGEANESTNIESLVYQRVLTGSAEKEYGSFLAEEACQCDCEPDYPTYHLLSLLVNAAIVADRRTNVVGGEEISRRLESLLSE